jgi:hypothetical protein
MRKPSALGTLIALAAAAGLALATTPSTAGASSRITPRPSDALPKPGANLLLNGSFDKPGPKDHEGAPPTDWTLVNLGAEKKPYAASIGVYNADGKYPPPKGNPNKRDIADQVYYEAGAATGVEGIGGQQAKFGFPISQADKPQVSFSNVEVLAPEAAVSDWAGSGLSILFTSGGKTLELIYLNPWTASAGTYPGKPVNNVTTKYILGPVLTANKWYTWDPRSLNADIKDEFKVNKYDVTAVAFINLEDTTDAGSPYPNMTGYMANVAIREG